MFVFRRGKNRNTGSYIRDGVFAANDGIITTFAVIAASQGAGITATIVIILGLANLVGDGFSMASGNYQGIKSEAAYNNRKKGKKKSIEADIWLHPLITFFAFVVTGLFPLFPYLLGIQNAFEISIVLVALSLFGIGCIRGHFSNKAYLKNGLESLIVGGIAALAAYFMAYWVEKYISR